MADNDKSKVKVTPLISEVDRLFRAKEIEILKGPEPPKYDFKKQVLADILKKIQEREKRKKV